MAQIIHHRSHLNPSAVPWAKLEGVGLAMRNGRSISVIAKQVSSLLLQGERTQMVCIPSGEEST
jgi:hypothetical protein